MCVLGGDLLLLPGLPHQAANTSHCYGVASFWRLSNTGTDFIQKMSKFRGWRIASNSMDFSIFPHRSSAFEEWFKCGFRNPKLKDIHQWWQLRSVLGIPISHQEALKNTLWTLCGHLGSRSAAAVLSCPSPPFPSQVCFRCVVLNAAHFLQSCGLLIIFSVKSR